MANEHYSEFVAEAFIKPIRSVLIIDDDYPTFDEILAAQIQRNGELEIDTSKAWHEHPERIKNVIDSFRKSGRALLVDVHDGENVTAGDEVKVAAHLHQSDLLVLDFELDKSRRSDGTRAIQILRNLMTNDHFNLVVIHTRETLESVFYAVREGLLAPSANVFSHQETEEAQELIEGAEDKFEGFGEKIFESIGNEQYFHSRLHATSIYLGIMAKGQQPYSTFSELCDAAGLKPEDKQLILRHTLVRVQNKLRPKMNVGSSAVLDWSPGTTNWIRSDSVFIAFTNKRDEGDLLAELQKALNNWNPQPSRLFLARLRAEMDERGVVAQGQALGDKHALAHWYERLLTANGSQRRWYIAESVSRHSEQLMSAILPPVENFAKRLIEAEIDSGEVNEICKNHFKVDLTQDDKKLQAEREHNAFVCSKKPEGWHLTTGHVFAMNDEHWVCLSPACDMVPSQLSNTSIETFGERLPFIAVKLQPIPDENKRQKGIQTNRFVFLHLGGDVKGFCFNKPSADNSAPHRHALYAENRGKFVEGSFNFTVLRTEIGKTGLISNPYNATVISQLRYEYALNLMQRLGMSLTRIGLDFAG